MQGCKEKSFNHNVCDEGRKKITETDPLFFDLLEGAYTPYFKDFEGSRAQTFLMRNLVLCTSYAVVSEDPTVGSNQTAEAFGEILIALSCSLGKR